MTRFEFGETPRVIAVQVSTESLGDHSYVVGIGSRGVIVDPQRDIDRFMEVLDAEGLDLAAVFETHIHNDYVSGGAVLARQLGADYVLPAGSGASIDHRAIVDREDYEVGGWSIRALHTPGHTPHHMSYALVGPDGPVAVFTGGSMLVGAVGRSDLLGAEFTDALLEHQFRSVWQLAAELPNPTRVGPTHGAGSFCSASEVLETTTTIERERTQNPALLTTDVGEFARSQRAGYRLYPAYYAHMGPANLKGAGPIPLAAPARLTADAVAGLIDEGVPVVDLRPGIEWAAGHIPGTVGIPLSSDVGTYVGWLFPWNRPVALLAASESAVSESLLQLRRIGHDAVAGVGIDLEPAWVAGGRSLVATAVADFRDVVAGRPQVILDVRDPKEVETAGAVAGAVNVHVSRLQSAMGEIPAGSVWVSCASGYRATIAAGLLEAAGRTPVLVLDEFERYREAAAATTE